MNHKIARNSPLVQHSDIFKSLPKSKDDRNKREFTKHMRNGATLKIKIFDELDMSDQDLLLSILALSRNNSYAEKIDIDDNNQSILKPLNLAFSGENKGMPMQYMPAIRLSLSILDLLTEMKKAFSGTNRQLIKDSLDRLSAVMFKYECFDKDGWSGSFNLLNWSMQNDTNVLLITLNPISASAILYDKFGYVNISREERHVLKRSDVKALHSVLCGHVNHGQIDKKLSLSKAASSVFCEYKPMPLKTNEAIDDYLKKTVERKKNAMKYRRNAIKNAAKAINELDHWSVKIVGVRDKAQLVVSRDKISQIKKK